MIIKFFCKCIYGKKDNKNLIFLFDELAYSLYPKLQKNLLNFLEIFSDEHQVFYTTHSPFLVNSKKLSNYFIVYKKKQTNNTEIFNYLNSNRDSKGSEFYKVINLSLGLDVIDSLFQNTTIILVEGSSDVLYFEAIKNYLEKLGKWEIKNNVIFLSANGNNKIKLLWELFDSHNKKTFAIYDSDPVIKNKKAKVKKINKKFFFSIGDIDDNCITVEDLFDSKWIQEAVCDVKKISDCKEFDKYFKKGVKGVNYEAIKKINSENSEPLNINNTDKNEIAKLVEKKLNKSNCEDLGKNFNKYLEFHQKILNILKLKN